MPIRLFRGHPCKLFHISGPRDLFHPVDLALYEKILEGQAATLAAGADQTVGHCAKGIHK